MPPLPWIERWLDDSSSRMAGRPDCVERTGAGLRVVDHKTGVRQAEPTEEQLQQLHFYAALVERVLGELPTRVAVRDAAGTEHVWPVKARDVSQTRRRSLAALKALREAAGAPGRLEFRPGEASCSICPYRVVCQGFLEADSAEWKTGHVRVGRVREIVRLDGRAAVDVDVLAPSWGPTRMRLIGFPFPADVAADQTWAFSDFEGPAGSGAARWNTLVFRWS